MNCQRLHTLANQGDPAATAELREREAMLPVIERFDDVLLSGGDDYESVDRQEPIGGEA